MTAEQNSVLLSLKDSTFGRKLKVLAFFSEKLHFRRDSQKKPWWTRPMGNKSQRQVWNSHVRISGAEICSPQDIGEEEIRPCESTSSPSTSTLTTPQHLPAPPFPQALTTWRRWGKQGARITARYPGVNTNSVLALANEVGWSTLWFLASFQTWGSAWSGAAQMMSERKCLVGCWVLMLTLTMES